MGSEMKSYRFINLKFLIMFNVLVFSDCAFAFKAVLLDSSRHPDTANVWIIECNDGYSFRFEAATPGEGGIPQMISVGTSECASHGGVTKVDNSTLQNALRIQGCGLNSSVVVERTQNGTTDTLTLNDILVMGGSEIVPLDGYHMSSVIVNNVALVGSSSQGAIGISGIYNDDAGTVPVGGMTPSTDSCSISDVPMLPLPFLALLTSVILFFGKKFSVTV